MVRRPVIAEPLADSLIALPRLSAKLESTRARLIGSTPWSMWIRRPATSTLMPAAAKINVDDEYWCR